MKVALVCDFLTKFGGAQRALLALHEAYPDAPIYCLAYDEEGTKGKFRDCKIIESSLGKLPRFLKKRTKFFLPSLPKRIEEFDFSAFDVVVSSSDSYSHGVITKPDTFHLCYCHTPMRYIWDWHQEYLRENGLESGLKSLVVRNILHKIRIWDRVAAHRVDKWIANSVNVQERIKKYYQADSDVIYPPVDIEKIKPSDLSKDYYLVLSRLEPYKKVRLAIEACSKLGKKLIVIGEGSELHELKKIASKEISFLGWKSDQEAYEYLSHAKALIFPGEEDFGITPVESMAAGRPVIAYGKGGAVESIIDRKTGLFFCQPTLESLMQAIEEFEKIEKDFTNENCRQQALKFSKASFIKSIKNTVDQSYHKYMASQK